MENLKYIEAGLRAAEGIRMTHRRIWMILEIDAQISANGDVGIKEMVELRLEADRLFDADGNLKPETDEAPEKILRGFDFGAEVNPPPTGTPFYTNDKNGSEFHVWKDKWNRTSLQIEWLDNGEVFLSSFNCQQYVNYLNSLTDGHS